MSSEPMLTAELYDRQDNFVLTVQRPHSELAEATVIRFWGKSYVFVPGHKDRDHIAFREAKVVLNLTPAISPLTELKADVLEPRQLHRMLFLLQHNEISMGKAKEVLDYWVQGTIPKSEDLPVVSMDNPLVHDDDAPMDVLRDMREHILNKRAEDLKRAMVLQAAVDNWDLCTKQVLVEILDYLQEDAWGKIQRNKMDEKFSKGHVPQGYTLKVQAGGKLAGVNVNAQPAQEFVFYATPETPLTPEQEAAGYKRDFIPGVGHVIAGPIPCMSDASIIAEKVTGIPQHILNEIDAAATLAVDQFSHSVKAALAKFRLQE